MIDFCLRRGLLTIDWREQGVCIRRVERERGNMGNYKMGVVESRFADLVWEHEPIGSGDLVRLAGEELNWKKSTTYTVIKKLCDKGIFKNESSVVTSAISREQYLARQSRQFVEDTFAGSLPGFLAAFTKEETLSQEEIAQIQKLIDDLG